jgi:HlyD family secretion protein
MKKRVLWFLVAALVVVCGGGGLAFQQMQRTKMKTAPATNAATVEEGPLVVSVVATGTIDAKQAVDVKSRVTGRLLRLNVDEGDSVAPQELLAIIDPQETRLQLQQNQAQLRGAQSGVVRASLEVNQRRQNVVASLRASEIRVKQLELELKAQPTLTKAAIDQAQTALSTVTRERIRLITSAHPNQIDAQKRETMEALANQENARIEYERRARLREQGFVAGREVEQAKLTLDLANLRVNNARENQENLLRSHAVELEKADLAIREAQAGLNRARANAVQDATKRQEYLSALIEVDRARSALMDPAILEQSRRQNAATVDQLRSVVQDTARQLRETEIRAPFGGVVTRRTVELGDLITGLSTFGSGTTIVRIEDRRSMLVKLDVNEIDVAKMRVGMKAKIEVDAIPDKTFEGVIRKIAPASIELPAGQSTSGVVVKFKVEIEVLGVSNDLRSGMTAKCTVNVVDLKNVLTLPQEYVARKGQRRVVKVLATDEKGLEKATEKEITIGSQSGSKVQIISGLRKGDRVQLPDYTGPDRKGMMQFGPDD